MEIETVLDDAIKLLSFSVGSQWNKIDVAIIISNGEQGLAILMERYKNKWFE
jgi:hypothetical protein